MRWFDRMRQALRPAEDGREGPPAFPTMATFFGLAAVMLVLWLLAIGLPHLLSAPDQPLPPNNNEAGASK